MRLARGLALNAVIGVLACASAGAIWATRDVASTKDSAGRDHRLLPVFRSEDVKRLELSSAGQKVTLERAAGDGGAAAFLLVEPVKELADAAAVGRFLSGLASARALRPVEPGPPLSSFGLDNPSLRVNVRTAKSSYQLALGGNAPTPEGARYLQVVSADGATQLVVVSKSVAEDLALELDAFRTKSLVSVSEADVARITITSPTLNVTLHRRAGTGFMLDGEPQVLAERETLKSLFFQLGRLSAISFLSAHDAEAALGPARAHFELETKDPKQIIRFDAGGSCPGDPSRLVIMRRAPDAQSACAARELEATLKLEAADFADRHAFSLRVDEVEELDITGGPNKFALVRKGSSFVLHGSNDTQVELEAGNQRITALLEALGERVPQPKLNELGLDPAPITITLRSSASRDSAVMRQVVRVGNKDASGNQLVYREQDGVALRIPHELARAFALDSTLLYARKLTEFGLSSFISAEVERAGTRQVLRRGANEALFLDAPKGFDPDGVLSSDFIQALGALTAERFVADRDDGTFGLSHPTLAVHFVYKSDESLKTERHLRFGDDTALGVYGTIEDAGPVFILPRSVRDSLELLLINRAVFPTSPDALVGMTLKAHGHTLRLQRQGERLVASPAGSFPGEHVTQILESFGDLRPEAAIHAGPPLPQEGMGNPTLTLTLVPRVGAAQTLEFGAGDSWHATSVFYLRVSGVDATFVMAQSKVRALSDAL